MKFIKDLKGQGAIEYLLIIAGAILLAAVVLAVLTGVGKSSKSDVNSSQSSYSDTLKDLNNEI